jgi:hypothetical protein
MTPKQLADAGPRSVYVVWMADVPCRDFDTGELSYERVPTGRWFPAERWAWKHVLAFKALMERRQGKGSAWIEEDF